MIDTKMNLENATIGVVGLGYLGLPLAVGFSQLRPIIGFDIKTERISELRGGNDSTLEIEPHQLSKARHLTYSSAAADLSQCQIFIVTVPTPIDQANRPDLTPLIRASEMIRQRDARGRDDDL